MKLKRREKKIVIRVQITRIEGAKNVDSKSFTVYEATLEEVAAIIEKALLDAEEKKV